MRLFTRSLLLFVAFLFLFGCAAKQLSIPTFEAKQFNTDMYTSKVDNFIILFDASGSMETYNKFGVAQALVYRMNDAIPEIGQTAGLRSFGHAASVSANGTQLFYGMEKYLSHNLENNFEKISKPGGTSPMYKAIDAAGEDLYETTGKTAAIFITDGLDLPGDVLASSKILKSMYGDDICFYPVLVGDAKDGESLLKQIAEIGKCGFYSTADELLTSDGMAAFVEKVFLSKKDGMAPAPAPAAPVVSMKKDSDGDGVYDEDDKCPGTPAGAKVNPVGCWSLDTVLFDFDKDVIKRAAYSLLDDTASILHKNSGMKVELHGHCDNVGTPDYNMDLSIRRAESVKSYLVVMGIDKNRMTTKGFGYTKPIALNGTEVGRSLNRRVEIHPIK